MPYPPSAPPKIEEILHLPTGLRLSIDGMIEMLSGARLVCVGETHDNLNDQRVELTVVRELHRRFPREGRRRDGDVPGAAAGGPGPVGRRESSRSSNS